MNSATSDMAHKRDELPATETAVASSEWIWVWGRRYLRGRKFGYAHAIIFRMIDCLVDAVCGARTGGVKKSVASFERVLVTKLDHIGDLLIATPFLAAIKDQQKKEGGQLKLVVGRWNAECAELLRRSSLCDSIDYIDLPSLNKAGSRISRILSFVQDLPGLVWRLRQWQPSLAVDLRPFAPNGLPICLASGARLCAGFGTRGFSGALDIVFPYRSTEPIGQMILDGLHLLCPTSGSSTRYPGPCLPLNAGERAPALRKRFGLVDGAYYILHADSREEARMGDRSLWPDIVKQLAQYKVEQTVLLVGARFSATAESITQELDRRGVAYVSAVGQTTFEELALLCKEATGSICIDSVVAHLSLSFRRTTLVLMVNSISFRGSYPTSSNAPQLIFAPVEVEKRGVLRSAIESFVSLTAVGSKLHRTAGFVPEN